MMTDLYFQINILNNLNVTPIQSDKHRSVTLFSPLAVHYSCSDQMHLHIFNLSVHLCDEYLGQLILFSPASVEMLVWLCYDCLSQTHTCTTRDTENMPPPPKSSKCIVARHTADYCDLTVADNTICVLTEFVSLQNTVAVHC